MLKLHKCMSVYTTYLTKHFLFLRFFHFFILSPLRILSSSLTVSNRSCNRNWFFLVINMGEMVSILLLFLLKSSQEKSWITIIKLRSMVVDIYLCCLLILCCWFVLLNIFTVFYWSRLFLSDTHHLRSYLKWQIHW